MKLKYAVFALAAFCLFQKESVAQSSVTLYGLAGSGIRWTNNMKGGNLVAFANGMSTNKFGLTGKEDLGGAMSAFFVLESGFKPATGALNKTSIIFDQAAYVGVIGNFGRISLGRQLSVAEDFGIAIDPHHISGSIVALVPDYFLGINTFSSDSRFNNMVKYAVKIGGATVAVDYSLGGVSGNFRAGTNYAGLVTYQTGTLLGGATFQRNYSPDASQCAQQYQVGGYWQVANNVRLYLSYLGLTLGGVGKTPSQRRDAVPQGGVVYTVTPQLSLTGAYYVDIAGNLGNVRNATGRKTTAYVIVDYFLSKKTDVYAEVDYNTFKGAYRTDPTNLSAFGRNPATTSQLGATIGISVRF